MSLNVIPQDTLLSCFSKQKWSEAIPVNTDRETGFQIYDFCLGRQRITVRGLKLVGFLKGLESLRRFSYKTTEIMEQHERPSAPFFACGVN